MLVFLMLTQIYNTFMMYFDFQCKFCWAQIVAPILDGVHVKEYEFYSAFLKIRAYCICSINMSTALCIYFQLLFVSSCCLLHTYFIPQIIFNRAIQSKPMVFLHKCHKLCFHYPHPPPIPSLFVDSAVQVESESIQVNIKNFALTYLTTSISGIEKLHPWRSFAPPLPAPCLSSSKVLFCKSPR